ncbi:MAG TPA: peptidylprolyl isomerase [Wenzhouxiangellaceae bacterium]|nr:peptidylprolyl isomerase [Wenzhouxiangellaceae bacterium]
MLKPAALGQFIVGLSLFMGSGITPAQEVPTGNVERELEISYAGEVLATRSGVALSLRDLDGRMASVPADRRSDAVGAPERVAGILNGVLLTHYLADSAVDHGLLADPEIQAEIHMAAMEILARKERDRYVEERLLEDYTSQARENYLLNPESFRQPERATFTHILLRTDNTDTDAEVVEEQAKDLLERARAGEAISDLAIEYSEDPSVQNNGGYFSAVPIAELEPSFRSGIESVDEGEIELIQSAYGFHVLELDELLPERLQPFEEVADELRAEARAEHAKQIFESYAATFYDGELELTEGAVARIIDRYTASNQN